MIDYTGQMAFLTVMVIAVFVAIVFQTERIIAAIKESRADKPDETRTL